MVAKDLIMHLITAAKNASPFDVNMAFDAGYEKIAAYTNVALNEVVALTQDAIFSRSPSGIKREALFFGGRDIHLALEMQKTARSAMFKPFEVSTFADPSGAFTTAAAMLAKVESHLKTIQKTLSDQTVVIFGAAGAVGSTVAMIAAKHGATVIMVAHSSMDTMQAYADKLKALYDLNLQVADGTSIEAKQAILNKATVALACGPAGVCILRCEDVLQSKSLLVVADVNAVPPLGVEGLDVMGNGTKIGESEVVGFGALAIGQLKYRTQNKLLERMSNSEVPIHIDYVDAYEYACLNG